MVSWRCTMPHDSPYLFKQWPTLHRFVIQALPRSFLAPVIKGDVHIMAAKQGKVFARLVRPVNVDTPDIISRIAQLMRGFPCIQF